MSVETAKAPPGRYRLVEIDIWAADGFSGSMEECVEVVGDYRFLSVAKQIGSREFRKHLRFFARKRGPITRFHSQIHNDQGECILYYDGTEWYEPNREEATA